MKHTLTKKSSLHLRRGFTLLELIFVIIILGIVSSIGAELIAKTYESYLIQKAQYKAAIKTELALNQIANRLRYAIPGTVGARDSIDPVAAFINITDVTSNDHKVLQWVGYDGESFEATPPGWSGFCDIDAYGGGTTLPTPGSNLDTTTTIINNLGGNIANARIFFPDGTSYGVDSAAGETITLDAAITGNRIYERYKLAWSSYALEVDNNNDLWLHYNFAPTTGTAIGGSSNLLLQNVTNFRFQGSEGSLRIKICKEERVGGLGETIHACKEKVIF